jgi:hypothetical protein
MPNTNSETFINVLHQVRAVMMPFDCGHSSQARVHMQSKSFT